MISQISGTLVSRELDRVDIATAGGVTYELLIPLGVYETLPRPGEPGGRAKTAAAPGWGRR